MRYITPLHHLLAFLLVLSMHAAAFAEAGDVTPEEAIRLINEATPQNELVILDIRTAPEFMMGHIQNAVHMNFYNSDFETQLSTLPRDKRYLLYCHSGSRSERALAMMRKMGFHHVYHLQSGIVGWYKADLPLEH
ncbi:rhodanese-like domain-containing protein [Desulfovibrio mangrovi]|uniref:rhodanese-like domain-containing protein n=1 Tax=Desulfovibrio mangrovi TaxID=2976983 RepID=UPI0022484ADF|nr:rhodanese-like domain-containing protein [Desulfovibrio mangrovi]UZP65851.1 rhodanese-like domain-containing protein [Desulfovibrio mangrovi]